MTGQCKLDGNLFCFFLPTRKKEEVNPTQIGTFGVCPNAQADTKANPKRANFADPPDNENLLKTMAQRLTVISNNITTFDTISQH